MAVRLFPAGNFNLLQAVFQTYSFDSIKQSLAKQLENLNSFLLRRPMEKKLKKILSLITSG